MAHASAERRGACPEHQAGRRRAEGASKPFSKVVMHPEYAATVAAAAYVWGWPIVNQFNRRAAITQAPVPGKLHGKLPCAPRGRLAMLCDYIDPRQTFVTCPNQDVVCGLGFFSVDEEPVILQVPEFGDRFWLYAIYDARTEQCANIGKPYGTRSGFYLLAGPNWAGAAPPGISAILRSSTELVNVIPRVHMDDSDEDRAAIQPLINQIVAYPLDEFDGSMRAVDWKQAPTIHGSWRPVDETGWVVPETFFDQLGAVLDAVPPLRGEEALYAQFRQLLAAAEADPLIRHTLVDTARETETSVITPFFEWQHNGCAAGNGWNRSASNTRWGFDYFNRTGAAKSKVFDNNPEAIQHFYTDEDLTGRPLDGRSSYELTFAPGQEPPVSGFWSLTLYNEHHFLHPNTLERYALGTRNKDLVRNGDGSLTIHASARFPGQWAEANWLPAPRAHFSLYIRAYWAKPNILDGSWQPPAIIRRGDRG